MSDGDYTLSSGFWTSLTPTGTPTATPTATPPGYNIYLPLVRKNYAP